MKFIWNTSLMVMFLFVNCSKKMDHEIEVQSLINQLQKEHAPDKRVAIFNLTLTNEQGKLQISGETDSEIGYQKLQDGLKQRNISATMNIRILPDEAVGQKKYAVGRNSVINIRSKPKHAAELGTQGLLGMELKVLDKEGDFFRVQTPDSYISWVDKGGITRMTETEFKEWQNATKIIFTKNFGFVYADPACRDIVSDITLGGKLRLMDDHSSLYKVAYPDQRIGYIKKEEAVIYNEWLKNWQASPDHIEYIAKTMLGFPYLWGGTSSKGMDCSGFTKMVYLMNGFIIPRDASQQVTAGEIVDKDLSFSSLQKGDLLFFGKKATETKKQRVTHVGIWLGNDKKEFIHASGNVHISSMDAKQANYDEFNKNRYLGSRRYLGVHDANIIPLKKLSIKP